MKSFNPEVRDYLKDPDNVLVSPGVKGVELNNPTEFESGTNHISIARITLEPNVGFERHVHPFNHVLVILEGAGILVYDRGDQTDGELEFKAGDVFNVPGTSEHAVSAGDKGVKMFSIGSPPMQLIDPERMVYVDEELQWMIPRAMELS